MTGNLKGILIIWKPILLYLHDFLKVTNNVFYSFSISHFVLELFKFVWFVLNKINYDVKLYTDHYKGEVIRATNCCNLQVEKRCCAYYHPPQTLSRNKISLLQVEAACCSKLNCVYFFSTNFSTCKQQNFVAWQCLRWMVVRATT